MASGLVNVAGIGEFVLPSGRLFEIFDSQQNASILAPDVRGPFNGHGVVDSVHLRAYRSPEEKQDAIIDLLKRNGATRVNGGAAAPAHKSAVA